MRVAPTIVLTSAEQSELLRLVQSSLTGKRLLQRARIVLLAARGMQNKDIAAELNVGRVQVARWRERYVQLGVGGIERDLPRGAPSAAVDVQDLVRKTAKSRPGAAGAWSTRTMAAAMGISPASVSRHWRANGLTPHVASSFKFTVDANLADTLDDVVGLSVSSAAHALVFCCDETPRLHAGNPEQSGSPGKKAPAVAAQRANLRRDSASLLAALNLLDGHAIDASREKPPPLECLRFLARIDRETPKGKTLHVFADDRAAYKHFSIQKWLLKHARVSMHFTPASKSWIDKVEGLFGAIADKVSRAACVSVPKLVAAIEARVAQQAVNAKPFIWTLGERSVRHRAVRAPNAAASPFNSEPPRASSVPLDARSRSRAGLLGKGHSLREHVTALKRDRILQEAAQLFFERGYLQTSVDAIAERLGATKPFVYYHFKSKVDILVEICERSNRDALAAAESAMSAKGSPRVRLEQFLREFTNIALEQHQLVAVYFREEISLPQDAADRINKMRKSINLRLSSLLSEGINSGDFQIEDPRMGALVIAGMSSYAFAWYRERGRLDQLEVTDRIVKMALKLVSAAPYHRPAYRVHSVAGA